MTDYRAHGKTGGVGTAAITNDDEYLLDIPEEVDPNELTYKKVKSERSF